jgi:CRP-like cAMP-binding protein
MNTANIIASISKHIVLSDEESAYFSSLLLPLHLRQGEVPAKAGEHVKYFIYVSSGCLMSYFTDRDGVDHVGQFATAGWWTGDLQSFTRQTPATFTTRALTDTNILMLPRQSMDQLLETHPKFEKYFRLLFQNSLITHSDRLIQNLSFTAEERYLAFQEKYPSLEQYVPLKYIASYLGMTPEFLSKIRRKRMVK